MKTLAEQTAAMISLRNRSMKYQQEMSVISKRNELIRSRQLEVLGELRKLKKKHSNAA